MIKFIKVIYQIAILLILCACNLNDNANKLLAQSVMNGDVSKVITYLESGADPKYKYSGFPIIFYSMAGKSLKCNSDVLSALLEYNANPNIEGIGLYPIHIAVSTGDVKCIDLLLKYGANINLQSSSGSTVLHEALVHNDDNLILYLLEKGAKTNIKDIRGVTALQAARKTGRHSIVKLLQK